MRKALASLPWVRNTEINYDAQTATVTVNAEEYDPDSFAEVLEDAGFGVQGSTKIGALDALMPSSDGRVG